MLSCRHRKSNQPRLRRGSRGYWRAVYDGLPAGIVKQIGCDRDWDRRLDNGGCAYSLREQLRLRDLIGPAKGNGGGLCRHFYHTPRHVFAFRRRANRVRLLLKQLDVRRCGLCQTWTVARRKPEQTAQRQDRHGCQPGDHLPSRRWPGIHGQGQQQRQAKGCRPQQPPGKLHKLQQRQTCPDWLRGGCHQENGGE